MESTHQQAVLEATSAENSAWVSAHAGSGKTYVLITRLVTLMLSGTRPEKLLCLTYTRSAAAEMKQRLNDLLGEWAVLPDAELKSEMKRRTGLTPTQKQINDVRQLFARAMDTPGGLKIQTIHAFCEALLNRFPLEAGISPGFKVMDERAFQALAAETQAKILQQTESDALREALQRLTRRINETGFNTLCKAITENRREFALQSADVRRDGLMEMLGVTKPVPLKNFGSAFISSIARETLADAANCLKKSGTNDQKIAVIIEALLSALDKFNDFEMLYPTLEDFFMTDKGPRTKFAAKAVAEEFPTETGYLLELQNIYIRLREDFLAQLNLQISLDIYSLADALLAEIDLKKTQQGYLDYDDLIFHADKLLSNRRDTGWVLYKLDGGIDHILVDEAQDTSPRQWSVISAIAEEFFSGEGASSRQRTLFAVGDEKQSIFSFQGADPDKFDSMRSYYAEKANNARADFKKVELTASWRSTQEVLGLVDRVCENPKVQPQLTKQGSDVSHTSMRTSQNETGGLVTLWPVEKGEARVMADLFDPRGASETASKSTSDSTSDITAGVVITPQQKVARKIAHQIVDWRDDPESNITPGDILILVQNRGPFVQDMIRALKSQHPPIDVAGADRMTLTDQLAVKDLICAGQIVLMPQDDLMLATFLRSPLGGMSEQDLMKLCLGSSLSSDQGRGQSLLACMRQISKDAASGEDKDYLMRISAALEMIDTLMTHAAKLPPYEFYAYLLDALSGRDKLRARLGVEVDDPVEELLNQALEYERQNMPSLQGFLHRIQYDDLQIKRDMEQGGAAVRIMTVHGAKGLEAPVVFLPDTCRSPIKSANLQSPISCSAGGNIIWQPSKKLVSKAGKETGEQERALESAEHKRLLYVALTRARDRLYVTGFLPANRNLPESCWYSLIEEGIQLGGNALPDDAGWQIGDASAVGGRIALDEGEEEYDVEHSETPKAQNISAINAPLPLWVHQPAKRESISNMPLGPSDYFQQRRLSNDSLPKRSGETSTQDITARQRGTVIHLLLEGLAGHEIAHYEITAREFLTHYPDLEAEHNQIIAEVMKLLAKPDLQMLFGPQSRAEVPIGGRVLMPGGDNQLFSGRIDRYVEMPEAILIADYKTTRHPPSADDPIDADIAVQLEIYRKLVSAAYPGKEVRCAIVWTAGPHYRLVTTEELDEAWQKLK
ncbi:MAG: double-strand break repair helicase AddA [Candidatus Micropelagos sp.]|nr:double-strand break repair helicase AddA [Candidatus Micropelagos sp.]